MTSHRLEYLDTAADVDRLLARIASTRELAIDTEGASFHRFIDRIYLIQLSTRELNAIIDPLPVGVPARLRQLLEDPKVEIVFHDADYDLRLLHQDYGWHVRSIFDTRIAAQLLGHKSIGLAALLERYFGVRLDKKHQRADWSMRPLTPPMLEYAVQDTAHLLDLRDRLREELERAGRMSWAREEFERLEGTRWDPADEADAFLRIKGARDLDRRPLAVLRELVAWRDGVARHADKATFRVAANDLLLRIAADMPRSRSELGAMRAVPPWLRDRHGDAIIEAVKRGLAVPESELPKFPRSARWQRDSDYDARVTRLRAVRDAAAQRLDLDPGVLFPRERLEAVARATPKSVDELRSVDGVRQWQSEVLGPALVAASRE